MARAVNLSYTSVQRTWQAHELKPHLVKTFKVSNEKRFVEKVQDIVGLSSIRRNRRWCFRLTKRARSGARPNAAGLTDEERPRRHHDA